MINIAIFASGNGTNAQRIAEYFNESTSASVTAIYCNNPQAYVLERAAKLSIPSIVFNKQDFHSEVILNDLKSRNIDLIILAGFLWLIPQHLINAYNKRIINIHPALLPLHGGKGMYGSKVHESVILNKDKESGITIHLIDEEYDKGKVLYQAKCMIEEGETSESLAQKIHLLEYQYFPTVIEDYIKKFF